MKSKSIPVIDIFSGPGGLAEGFSAAGYEIGKCHFAVNLSIEKDPAAHSTLELRSFFREFPRGKAPAEYYSFLRGEISRALLFDKFPDEASRARKKAWKAELGGREISEREFDKRIKAAIGSAKKWVLIGGPPCQAYSVAGRSRYKGVKGYRPEKDHRHFLYQEYLGILCRHWPPVFVMENVKGLISSRVNGDFIFNKIVDDLTDPCKALKMRKSSVKSSPRYHRYRIYSLVKPVKLVDRLGYPRFTPGDYVIESEHFGIPQSRHRLILLGIRDDLNGIKPDILSDVPEIPARDVLKGLPRLRSGLSREEDSPERWRVALREGLNRRWLKGARRKGGEKLHGFIREVIKEIRLPRNDRGGEFIPFQAFNAHEN